MRVKYVGGIGPVEIAATGQVVENGAECEVDDELGKALCEQAAWEEVKKAPKAASKEGE